jgi:hypothetical protein
MSATLALLKGGKAQALNKELDGPDEETPVTENAADVDAPEPEVVDAASLPETAVTDATNAPGVGAQPVQTPAPAAAAAPAKAKYKKATKGAVSQSLGKVLHGEVLASDPIQDVAHQVENLTEENALAMARQLADEAEFNFFRLGAVLSVIQLNKWYLPYDSFRLFVEGEFSIGYRTASYAVELYRTLVDLGIPWEQVKSAGWTKLVVIKDVINPENVGEWVEKAGNNTALQLGQMVQAAKADPEGKSGDGPKPELETLTVKVTADQKQMIKAALAKAKNEMGDGTKSDGFSLEMICTSYMNGGGKIVQSSEPKSVLEQIKDAGLVNFLTEIDELLQKKFPGCKFDVDVPPEYN